MATLQYRGKAVNVKYTYFNDDREYKTQWETYYTELEAIQRKGLIDLLQKHKDHEGIRKAVAEYKEMKNRERIEKGHKINDNIIGLRAPKNENNLDKTLKEFLCRWLPFHARIKRYSPNTIDGYISNINVHLNPAFGNRIMDDITGEEWDEFFENLAYKKVGGTKASSKHSLAPASILKIFHLVSSCFKTAKSWKYISEIPQLTSPKNKSFAKRVFWDSSYLYEALSNMPCDPHTNSHLIHLAVHMAFIGSLRAGEVTGIKLDSVSLERAEYWVEEEVQRVSEEALNILPDSDISFIFPRQKENSTTRLILKDLKTDESVRKQYMTLPLRKELARRLKQIEINKAFHGHNYHDYGLLLCHSNGDPLEPRLMDRWFKKWQRENQYEDLLDFQGLRKSGQMQKKNLRPASSGRALEAIAAHSKRVRLKHYDETLESEKRSLIEAVEFDFYTKTDYTADEWERRLDREEEVYLEHHTINDELLQRLLQKAQLKTSDAQNYAVL